MPNNSGIFSLSNYYDKDLSGDIPEKSRESFREYGYFGGGGFPGGVYAVVERIDYSNDTSIAISRGALSAARNYLAGTGNANFGYFSGGSSTTRVDRVNYINDTATASSRGTLLLNNSFCVGNGNTNFGYLGGNSNSRIQRINYSNDLSNATITGLIIQRSFFGSCSSSNFGYFAGGTLPTPGARSNIERISYSNDNVSASIRGPLSTANFGLCGTGNNNFGYFGGTQYSLMTRIDRIDYSNDNVRALNRTQFSLLRGTLSATGNSNFGYFGGGSFPGPTYSTVDRIDYSNDTVTASVRGPLSVERRELASTSSHSFGGSPISQYGVFPKPFGYFGGGGLSISKIDYNNDTNTGLTRGSLSSSRSTLAATGNSNFGYFGGGAPGISTIDRIDYYNDNQTALVRGPLSIGRGYINGATGNSNFGYFGGGINPGVPATYSTVDRISYSNDTSTTSVRGSLTVGKYGSAASGTLNFGYFYGGNTSTTRVERIDYSNDNSAAITRTNLNASKLNTTASGNLNFGYVGGGDPITSLVDRLDYANDTAAVSTRGPLSSARTYLSATGNNNFGYFGAGRNPGAGVPSSSVVDRIDYANDTPTTSIRGPLSITTSALVATSPTAFGGATDFQPTQTFFDIQSMRRIEDTTNASVKKRALGSFGYWIGGSPGSSTIQRLDLSNDLSNASSRSSTSVNTFNLGSTSTNNYGWIHGGDTGSTTVTFTDRIDFSNDTAKPSNRSYFIGSRECGATGNLYYGWVYSGYDTSRIIRLDYSNDLGGFLTRNNLTERKRYPFGVGNLNYGWICGGQDLSGPNVTRSTIERLDYSNDNVRPSVRGSLTAAKYRGSTTGNLNFGYYGGGRLSPSTGPLVATIEKINYSNDTSNAIVRTSLSGVRYNLSATGNNNFGYFGHGAVSTVERLDYSNDSASTSIRGPLVNSLRNSTATTNARTS